VKAKELRTMTAEELRSKAEELKKELFNLRMRHATSQIENPLKLRMLRRDIARVQTIAAEKKEEA